MEGQVIYMPVKHPLFPAAAALIMSPVPSAFAQQHGQYADRMMGPGYHGFWGMGLPALLLWLLVVAGLVVLIRWVWQMTTKKTPSANPGQRALDILKERYAKGEIDKAAFDRIKKDLEA